jgi:predicted nucleic acid-binding protein
VAKLTSLIEGKLVAFDSAPLIYYLEKHPRYLPLSRELFGAMASQLTVGLTSVLTLLEVLVVPLRAGAESLANDYRRMLNHTRGLTLYPVDHAVSERAAKMRADNPWLRTPDALQIATALEHGAQLIVTNDNRWKRLREIPVVVFDDYLAVAPE